MTYLELYLKAEHELSRNEITLGEFEKMIEPLSAEITQPEIIHCCDCIFKEIHGVDLYCDQITGEWIMVRPNDYCSWAERREE